MMKIGINWNAYGKNELSDDEQIKLLLKYGFRNVFVDSEYPDIKSLISELSDNGIICDTCHAPFDGINNMWMDEPSGDEMLERLRKSIDICCDNNVPVLIVHLSSGDNCPRINDIGYSRFRNLAEYSDSKNIRIAFENQRKLANLSFAMEEFTSAGFCWDVGHEKCFAYGREFMPLFGDRLCALHIHDNYMKHNGDKHMIPFDGLIDYNVVAGHIAKSGFNGTLMLEVMRHSSDAYDNYTPDMYYKSASDAAEKINGLILEYKEKAGA